MRIATGSLAIDDCANAVDMAGDDMPAQFIANLQCALEVEPTAFAPQTAWLCSDAVSAEASTANQPIALVHHGQAYARTGN
jgi:hypothetical protein